MHRKSIIQGRLEFGSAKSFYQMLKMYDYRVESFYKNALLFKDDVFDEENLIMDLPRLISIEPVKYWNNTIKLLEYLAQFALSGSVSAWLVHEGKVLKYAVIQPKSDKAVVQNFIKGQKLADQEGKEQEAIEALTKAINKHDKHAQAYERRGYVNYMLENWAGALYDFNKCLGVDPNIPSAYYWRAKVHMRKQDWDKAIDDLEMTAKKAIALQPIYWKARRLKAYCHSQKKEYELAARELRLFTNRKFTRDNPNYRQLRDAFYEYAVALMQMGKYSEALEALEKGLALEDEQEAQVPMSKFLTLRGQAKHKIGQGGQKDWEKAAELGSTEAEKLLAEFPAP